MNNNFIFTPSKDVAKSLESKGYQLFQKNEQGWTFINDNKLSFDSLKDIIYTDKIFT